MRGFLPSGNDKSSWASTISRKLRGPEWRPAGGGPNFEIDLNFTCLPPPRHFLILVRRAGPHPDAQHCVRNWRDVPLRMVRSSIACPEHFLKTLVLPGGSCRTRVRAVAFPGGGVINLRRKFHSATL